MRAPMKDLQSATAIDLVLDDMVRRRPKAIDFEGHGPADLSCADLEGASDADILASPAAVPVRPVLADLAVRSSARPWTGKIAFAVSVGDAE